MKSLMTDTSQNFISSFPWVGVHETWRVDSSAPWPSRGSKKKNILEQFVFEIYCMQSWCWKVKFMSWHGRSGRTWSARPWRQPSIEDFKGIPKTIELISDIEDISCGLDIVKVKESSSFRKSIWVSSLQRYDRRSFKNLVKYDKVGCLEVHRELVLGDGQLGFWGTKVEMMKMTARSSCRTRLKHFQAINFCWIGDKVSPIQHLVLPHMNSLPTMLRWNAIFKPRF